MPDAVHCSSRLVFKDAYRRYDFGDAHPLTPRRMETGVGLLEAAGMVGPPGSPDRLEPPPAAREHLLLAHAAAYVDGVQHVGLFADDPLVQAEAARWGLGRGDTPAFSGMHDVSADIAGGTLHAVEGVVGGAYRHAFNPAGGLHHAMRARAAGFCIYNDASIAIAATLARGGVERVLYLDFDAHHGDGVQAAFLDDPRVLTFSVHESGRHLFPGTGYTHEVGAGAGHGYAFNLPMEPFTEDDSWTGALERLLPLLFHQFKPDLVVSQHGCDSHVWDPLTHLRLSTQSYVAQAQLVHTLAHASTAAGRWVALGGGGYDWVRVVPRSWAIVWAEMSGRGLPPDLPPAWAATWEEDAVTHDFWPLPTPFLDQPSTWPRAPRRAEIERVNREHLEALLRAAETLVPPRRQPD